MISQSIAYLLNGNEHIYWILDLEGEMHSIWDLWISGLQECKDNDFFEVGWTGSSFRSDPKNLKKLGGQLPLPESTSPISSLGEL